MRLQGPYRVHQVQVFDNVGVGLLCGWVHCHLSELILCPVLDLIFDLIFDLI